MDSMRDLILSLSLDAKEKVKNNIKEDDKNKMVYVFSG